MSWGWEPRRYQRALWSPYQGHPGEISCFGPEGRSWCGLCGCVGSGPWTHSSGICAEMDWVVFGSGAFVFARSWWCWYFEVSPICPLTSRLVTIQWNWQNRVRSYEHHNINEPAILLGSAFHVDFESKSFFFSWPNGWQRVSPLDRGSHDILVSQVLAKLSIVLVLTSDLLDDENLEKLEQVWSAVGFHGKEQAAISRYPSTVAWGQPVVDI